MTQSYRSLTTIYLLINVCIAYGYKASVVEYNYQYANYLSSTDNLMRNAVAQANLVRLFSKKSDIIVFPEESLHPVGAGSEAAYISVPLPSFQNTNFSSKALQIISDAAKSAKIYVVINVPERDGKQIYSTNIAFRRNGTIAAKYRKYNVLEKNINRPTLEAVTFTTDFGVTFGLISSSDLLFLSPADDLVKQGVQHFVCLSSWSSLLPFLTAIQIQQSWSWSRDVTLLAAGLNIVKSGQTGSGIYTGRNRNLTKPPSKYYFANIPTTMIITTNLQASNRKGGNDYSHIDFNLKKFSLKRQKYSWMLSRFSTKDTENVQATDNELKMNKSSFKPYTTKLISPNRNCAQVTPGGDLAWRCRYNDQLCNRNICCNFNLTVDYFLCNNPCTAESSVSGLNLDDGFFLFRYRMAVFEGVNRLGIGSKTLGAQICGIIPCNDETLEGCGGKPDLSQYKTYVFNFGGNTAKIWAESIRSVYITGNFTTYNSTIMPNILLGKSSPSFSYGLLTNDFNLQTSTNSASLQLPDHTRNLGAVGIVNRLYSLDGLPVTGSQQSVHGSLLISLIITQIFVSLVF